MAAPFSGSFVWPAIVAALPLVLLFVLLGVFKAPAWISSIATLVLCILLSILAWQIPVGASMAAMTEGLFFGLCQIMFLLVAALWVYNISVKLGWDRVLRDLLRSITDDQRVLALIIAFAFGSLIEGLAGFGTPVAITTAMLIAAGVPKMKAVVACMLGDTAPVAFGSIGAPLTSLGSTTFGHLVGIPATTSATTLSTVFGQMAGRQSPFMAVIVALFIVMVIDGKRGLKETWHVAIACGVFFGIAQFIASNFISYMITDIIAAGFCLIMMLVLAKVLKPRQMLPTEGVNDDAEPLPAQSATGAYRIWGALAPYAIIVVIFSLSQVPAIKSFLSTVPNPAHATDPTAAATLPRFGFTWPGLSGCHGVATAAMNDSATAAKALAASHCVNPAIDLYSILSSGVLLTISALILTLVYWFSFRKSIAVLGRTIVNLRYTIITIAAVLSIAYVMNSSGMTLSLGTALAATGAVFAFLSPVLGWLGVMLTGSDTSANALFGTMQVTAAQGVWAGSVPHQILMAASNSTGGVLGKMISPQSLSVAAAAAGMMNKEGDIFRKVLPWSLVLVIILGIFVVLQATVWTGMIPAIP